MCDTSDVNTRKSASRASQQGSTHCVLGDTTLRDYSRKLRLFNAFAEPELREAIAHLGLKSGMRVLDAGCGTGEALSWLSDVVGSQGHVVGIDLSTAHVSVARKSSPANITIVQGDLQKPCLAASSFDAIWSVNTMNHFSDPVETIRNLLPALRRGGQLAVAQSSFLPEMFFAWDSRLERLANEAVRQYYRDRYKLSEHELAGVRASVGWLRRANLQQVSARTFVVERIAPVNPRDEAYLVEAIFRGTWGERLKPYLSEDDYAALDRLCDPTHSDFALNRPDFHLLQTLTLVTGRYV
ncbi:MAG: class I SAM-dependent methyltransferase [Steroidobacteraceae bacterium]